MNTFVCAYCGETHSSKLLSNTSLLIAGTKIREAAVEHLKKDDLICKDCDTDVEAFEQAVTDMRVYDTVGLDTAGKQWLALNW